MPKPRATFGAAAVIVLGFGAGMFVAESKPPRAHASEISQKDDSATEGVPARCARIVNPAERRKCLQSLRK